MSSAFITGIKQVKTILFDQTFVRKDYMGVKCAQLEDLQLLTLLNDFF